MGLIYIIESPTGRKYIGQTRATLQRRWKEHIYDALDTSKNHCILLNNSIRKYGAKNFKVEIIYICPDEELDMFETLFIELYNSLSPNGLNLKVGGSSANHTEITKTKIRNALIGKTVSIERRQKQSTTTNPNLPMYVLKIKNGYRVCNHPMGLDRRWISKRLSMQEKLDKALEHLKFLNNLEKPVEPNKSTLPKYIQKRKQGYCVKVPNQKPRSFLSARLTDKEKFKKAYEYLKEFNVCSSETGRGRVN